MITTVEKREMTEEIRDLFKKQGFEKEAGRTKALESFLATGFPKSRSEEYKFTPVTRLLEKHVQWVNMPAVKTPSLSSTNANQIVLVNGRYLAELSSFRDKGITVSEDGDATPSTKDPFDLLNEAFSERTLTITITAGAVLSHPLHIIHYEETLVPVALHTRLCMVVGPGAVACVFNETQASGHVGHFSNRSVSVQVGEKASLEYVVVQNSRQEMSVNNTTIQMASQSKARCFTLTFDGKLIRNNLNMVIDGEGIQAHLFGLYLLGNDTLADNHTVVDHRQPNSESNELYKGIMSGQSKGVFNGKIFVRPQAQKTNAYQTNRNILLGDTATVNTKPQLEIWADDVKCSHGCTTGQLDEAALFYLRSRGISEQSAKGMMLLAFATETVTEIADETLRTWLTDLIVQQIATIR